MTIRRLPDPPEARMPPVCTHPQHEMPTHLCLPPGRYEHECPGCNRKLEFVVQRWGYLHGASETVAS